MSAWAAWSPEVFVRAKAEGKPLLAAGEEARGALRALEKEVEHLFITVLVDPQSRPDVAARIGPGRAVILDGEGARRGEFDLFAHGLGATLSRLAAEASPRARPENPAVPVWTGAVREKPLNGAPDARRVDAVFEAMRAAPSSMEVLEALLFAAGERGDRASLEILGKGLQGLFDSGWNSHRRYFHVPDESPLTANAARARLLWDAHALTGEARWRETAEATSRYLLEHLYDPGVGAFRRASDIPVFPAEGGARAVWALLRAEAFGVEGAREAVQRTLAFLQMRLYDPLLGLVHAQGAGEESTCGLLGDVAWTALAFTEAYLATGTKAHREFADGLMHFLFQELWEREGGGFLDRMPREGDPLILREARLDPALNAVALEACWRLNHLKGNANYLRWLEWALRGVWPTQGAESARIAGLARIADMAARGRLDLELVGRLGETSADELLSAARRLYAPRAIISFVDPDDQDYILAHKLEADAYPRLFGCGKDLRRLADAGDPARVADVLAAVRAAESVR